VTEYRGICCAPQQNFAPRNFTINRDELSTEEGIIYDSELKLELSIVQFEVFERCIKRNGF
jgi:hypothetical protein